MESTPLLYRTLVQVLGCHKNWLDRRHLHTLAWMIHGLILSGQIGLGTWAHRKFIRTTNLIERSFVEERRRAKTLPRFFTEKRCLKLVYAVLIRAAKRWPVVHITELEHQQIQLLYQQQKIAPTL
jgi:hypothetical protein